MTAVARLAMRIADGDRLWRIFVGVVIITLSYAFFLHYTPSSSTLDDETTSISYDAYEDNEHLDIEEINEVAGAETSITITNESESIKTETSEHTQVKTICLSHVGECRVIEGVVNSNFYSDAVKHHIPARTVTLITKLFSNKINFRKNIRKNDHFTFVMQGNQVIYACITNQKQKHELMYFCSPDGSWSDFCFANAEVADRDMFRAPLKTETRITSGFGERIHPISKKRSFHQGIDYSALRSTPVYAMASGKVLYARYNGGYGLMISITHPNNYQSRYAHLESIANNIAAGTEVQKGQLIGYVGSTGTSTGPHLHVEVLLNGKCINPLTVRAVPAQKLPAQYQETFVQQLQEIRQQLTCL